MGMIRGITRVAVCNTCGHIRAMSEREADGRVEKKRKKRKVLKSTLTGETGKTAKAQSTRAAYGERSDERGINIYTRI